MTRLGSLFVVALLPACAGEPLDASGTWNLQLFTGAGSCNNPGELLDVSVIADFNGETYVFTVPGAGPDDLVSGSFECGEECDFDLRIESYQRTLPMGTSTFLVDLHIDEALAISGTGELTIRGDRNCSLRLTATGMVQ
ncbi:MAG TPA: hypothetical protein VIU61_09065 [Kofleriaceae bacterium]